MGNQIIKHNNVSQETILKGILEYIATLPNYNDIKDSLNSSTMSVIYQLISGLGTWDFFYFNMLRRETYLSTASKSSSVYTIARTFGYNIDRGNCPKISVRYNDEDTIILKKGDIIGSYNNMDIVYFGKQKFVEKGDILEFCIGHYNKVNDTIKEGSFNHITISALNKKYIANNAVSFKSKDKDYIVSKNVEDYIVFGDVADFSLSPSETTIYISDTDYGYGIDIENGSEVTVEYLEINGEEPNLVADKCEINDQKKWIPISVLSTGSNPEKIEKIRKLAPLYFSTMRRAVTVRDYTYIARAHSLIRDAIAESISGTAGKWKISLKSTEVSQGTTYTISLDNTKIYSVTSVKDDTSVSVLDKMCEKINSGKWALAKRLDTSSITIENLDPRVKFSILVSPGTFENPEIITEQKEPPCCSLKINYIKHNQKRTGEVLSLTDSERLEYGIYLQNLKTAGTTIILQPAERLQIQVNLKLKVRSSKDTTDDGISLSEHIRNSSLKILDEKYEFIINRNFSYAELIADITKITAVLDGEEVQPIIAIETSDEVLEYELNERQYICVTDLILSLEME